jgi:hypothetical protein
MKRLAMALVFLQVVSAGSVAAQSLAAVARREAQRRRTIAKPSRVYTNKDLKEGRDSGAAATGPDVPAAPSAAAPATPGETGTESAEPAEQADAKSDQDAAATEQSWRARMKEARGQLDRSKMFAEALQTRANSLWADFTARDDPAQRAAIETDRKKTLAELDRVKGEIEAQTKAIADLEEEARRAGVPPGWLR